MWTKVIIAGLSGLMVTACGPSTDRQSKDEAKEAADNNPQITARASSSLLNEFPFWTSGMLPDDGPLKTVKPVQDRTLSILEMGLSEAYFSEDAPNPNIMLLEIGGAGQPKGWVMINDNRRLYLVKRHLRPVPKNKADQEFSEFCDAGALYSGYVAARPFTEQTVQAEALLEITANPYGLLVCDQAGALNLKLLDANHPILKT